MEKPNSYTRLAEYIRELLSWAHGHQVKGITDYVGAIIKKQTGKQAEIARSFGNQEAAVKRLGRLIHNERLEPKKLAEAVLLQSVEQLPRSGEVRLAIDWTIEGTQRLLVVSLLIAGRATPIYWRAYSEKVLKGRMKRYEMAVIKRTLERVLAKVGPKRVFVTADRGFADVELFELLESYRLRFIIRVRESTKVKFQGLWCRLQTLGFSKNERRRNLGPLAYCQSSPHRLYMSMSRARDKKGHWENWYLVSNVKLSAKAMCKEYSYRFGCEEGFRDIKWWLGFGEARIEKIKAWSRMFALFAIAILVIVTLGCKLLLNDRALAGSLLRRVVSRRRGRCELSLVSAMVALINLDVGLFDFLSSSIYFNFQATLSNVS
jgi:hypothetical protein